MVVYLSGGPYDGQYWDTLTLLGKTRRAPSIEYYDWTSELKTSETTGRVAPVWKFNEAKAQGRSE